MGVVHALPSPSTRAAGPDARSWPLGRQACRERAVDATFLTDLAARTRELRETGLYKSERILVSPQNAAIRVEV